MGLEEIEQEPIKVGLIVTLGQLAVVDPTGVLLSLTRAETSMLARPLGVTLMLLVSPAPETPDQPKWYGLVPPDAVTAKLSCVPVSTVIGTAEPLTKHDAVTVGGATTAYPHVAVVVLAPLSLTITLTERRPGVAELGSWMIWLLDE